jgi:CRP-like cAMP-binding protein
VILHEGDSAEALHLLTRGTVSIRAHAPSGNALTLAVLGPGETFGEMALVGQRATRAATVTALETTETLSLHRDQFEQLRATNPAVDRFLVQVLAGQVIKLDDRLMEAMFTPASERVLRRLFELCRLYGDGTPGTIVPLTQEMLASMAGTSRPTANQALRRAERAGLVAVRRASIQLLDPAGLKRRAFLTWSGE